MPEETEKNIPNHIAFIMDGNGRWAVARGLERSAGHKAGADAVVRVLEYAKKYHIPYITLYAFSTENWKRSPVEVGALMSLLNDFLKNNSNSFHESKIRLRIIGDIERIPWPARRQLRKLIEETAVYTEYNLTIALSYGSRAEITNAALKLARALADGKVKEKDVNEGTFAQFLQTADLPDPDLIIRTAGEERLSNFLLWQASYSEFLFMNVLWPDFNEDNFTQALDNYAQRQRRYGKA